MPRGTKRKIELLETRSSDEKPPKKIKLDLKHDAREEKQLPAELVLQLFRQLNRGDIVQCTMVCHQWYRIGQREEFQWAFVSSLIADEHSYGYYYQRHGNKIPSCTEEEWNKNLSNELRLWQSDPLRSGKPVRLETEKNETYGNILYMYDDQSILVAIAEVLRGTYEDDPVLTEYRRMIDPNDKLEFSSKSSKRLWKYTIEEYKYDNHQCEQDEHHEKSGLPRKWIVHLFINVKELDAMIIERKVKAIPNDHVLLSRINLEWGCSSVHNKALESNTFPYKPLVFHSSVSLKQPNGFKGDIKLFQYQLDAITWMKSVEDQVGQDVIYASPSRWNGSKTYFNALEQEIVHPRNFLKHIHKEKVRGGILADEVGLGKTFEVLGLILAAPPKTALEPHPELVASKSTLIMCPEHLCKQWHDEITRATTLSALVVRNYEELKQCTYEDFMTQYDVIVCAYDLLWSTKYLCLPNRRGKNVLAIEERNTSVKKALEQLQKRKNYNKAVAPIIDHFYFHRVVFDEALYAYLNSTYEENLWRVNGRSSWFVSATPFGNRTEFVEYSMDDEWDRIVLSIRSAPVQHFWSNRIHQLLGFEDTNNVLFDCYLDEMIFKHYFWCNTRESIKDEFIAPEPIEEVYCVEPSPIERAIYLMGELFFCGDEFVTLQPLLYQVGLRYQATHKLNRLKNNLGNNRFNEVALIQNGIEIIEQELLTMDERLARAKGEERALIEAQQRFGTKIAAVLVYLKTLLKEKPDSRVLMVSGIYHLKHLPALLNEHGISAISLREPKQQNSGEYDEDIVRSEDCIQAIEMFTSKTKTLDVMYVSNLDDITGANLIATTRVILLDSSGNQQRSTLERFETQAIGRAYRQGQTKPITVVRILFKDTIEHENYLKKNNMPLDELIEYDPETWKPSDGHENDSMPIKLTKLGKNSTPNDDSSNKASQNV